MFSTNKFILLLFFPSLNNLYTPQTEYFNSTQHKRNESLWQNSSTRSPITFFMLRMKHQHKGEKKTRTSVSCKLDDWNYMSLRERNSFPSRYDVGRETNLKLTSRISICFAEKDLNFFWIGSIAFYKIKIFHLRACQVENIFAMQLK